MVARLAVDGNTNGDYYQSSCTHTSQWIANPSWWVDLGRSYNIGRVVIFNRQDCCPERINPFNIHIGNSDQVALNPKCGGDHQIALNQPSISVSCQGMAGRYVGVRLPGNSRTMTLCEVQVFAGSGATSTIPDGYTERGGSYYKLFRTTKMDQGSAQQTCEADGGNLASIKTSSINSFLLGLIPDRENYWFGLNDKEIEGRWMWADGSLKKSCDYTNWAPYEPNDNYGRFGGQDCIHMWAGSSFRWDDDECWKGKYFICQIGPGEEAC
ncbi:C-type lectin lectoxin-Lio2-like [Branchiostoma floridae x Branchiostoma belcheri]